MGILGALSPRRWLRRDEAKADIYIARLFGGSSVAVYCSALQCVAVCTRARGMDINIGFPSRRNWMIETYR